MSPDAVLDRAIDASLDGLLQALRLQDRGGDRFEVVGEQGRFDRVFGGQLVAQGLLAAGATVEGKAPQSLHAYFVGAGGHGEPIELAVARVRDGRSISSRRVDVTQGGETLLVLIASFHVNPSGPDVAPAIPAVPAPDDLPLLQDWVREPPSGSGAARRAWVEHPPPLEIRIGEAPTFLGGAAAGGPRSHWMRLRRAVGDDPLLHASLLAYASDYLLLDAAFRSHPERDEVELTGTSLDHAVWFHRPVDLEAWHLHTQETVALVGERGLVRGAIHDAGGALVASVMQEVLVRKPRPT